MKTRCWWAGDDPLYVQYHDKEWGVPVRDDRMLFEYLVLDGAQAGLSWLTILRKRENYRRAFDRFEPEIVARYDDGKIDALLQDKGIVRNRMKIRSAVRNALAFLKVRDEFGTFEKYIWGFTGGKTIVNAWQRAGDVPSETAESRAMSRDLKMRGFNFVGPTICYAFMQAAGIVNDHLTECFRYEEVKKLAVSD
jgi:DNA-3-methyladenine glycosylase I